MQRNEFKAANDRLLDALKRLAPNAYWGAGEVYRQRGGHGELIGYSCQLNGRIVERGFLGLERARWIIFCTYSWSWDGTFDEAWLTEIIAKGADRGMWALSTPNWMRSEERDGPWRRAELPAPARPSWAWIIPLGMTIVALLAWGTLMMDLMLKAFVGALGLAVASFFGMTFGGMAYDLAFPAPPFDASNRNDRNLSTGRVINFVLSALISAGCLFGAFQILYVVVEHAYWLLTWDVEKLRIKRPLPI